MPASNNLALPTDCRSSGLSFSGHDDRQSTSPVFLPDEYFGVFFDEVVDSGSFQVRSMNTAVAFGAADGVRKWAPIDADAGAV